MDVLLGWLQGISAPLQILLIIILALVFKTEIWQFILTRVGYTDEKEEVEEKSSKDWFNDIVQMMTTLETNHLSHLQDSVTRVQENQANMFGILRNITEVQRDTIEILKDFKEYGIRCRNK